MRLDLEQARLIGSLVEKQLTTPQQYPLSLNALVTACNQTSNRDPVVRYDPGTVQRALASLKEAGLVRFVYPSHGGSATRYRQVLDEQLGLDKSALALIAVLLLRGPQTAGELRTRTERMTSFDGVTAVNAELERLGSLPEPLVLQLPRRPGQKEERWIQLLAPEGNAVVDSGAGRMDARRGLDLEALSAAAPFAVDGATEVGQARATPTGSELGALMAAVTTLRAEVAALRVLVEQLQAAEATRRAVVPEPSTVDVTGWLSPTADAPE